MWRASLDMAAAPLQTLKHALSPDECRRAERYRFALDCDRFIARRGLLRAILARYLHGGPDRLRFCYGAHGKPALVDSRGKPPLRFNVSHSGGLALYAVACDREVGIDLERVRPDVYDGEIAERFFSSREVASLRALPATAQVEAFFRCWTRKEAYVKARGEGLSIPLDQFDVSLAPGEPAALVNVSGEPREPSRWSLHSVSPAPDYAGALAAEGQPVGVVCWQWSSV